MLRFAPSPTGDMHIGNMRVALLSYTVAKQSNEPFLLRIEDTDTERNVDGSDDKIIKLLSYFGIHHNILEHQSTNTYGEYIQKLEKYTDNEYKLDYPKHDIVFHDVIRGDVRTKSRNMKPFRITRDNGSPLFNLACAVDDYRIGTSLIIRGEDHLSNTTKQEYIKQLLGDYKPTRYLHLPMLLDIDGSKLSKRNKASSVQHLLSEGFLPDAIANYILSLGYDSNGEIYTLEEAILSYDVTKISVTQPTIDITSMKYYNRKHLLLQTDEKLGSLLGTGDIRYIKYAKALIGTCDTINELKWYINIIGATTVIPDFIDRNELSMLSNLFVTMDKSMDYNKFLDNIKNESKLKGKSLFQTLRFLLSKTTMGIDLESIYNILYKEIK